VPGTWLDGGSGWRRGRCRRGTRVAQPMVGRGHGGHEGDTARGRPTTKRLTGGADRLETGCDGELWCWPRRLCVCICVCMCGLEEGEREKSKRQGEPTSVVIAREESPSESFSQQPTCYSHRPQHRILSSRRAQSYWKRPDDTRQRFVSNSSDMADPALHSLPNEILSLVANHLDRPRDVRNLALTSKRLHEFANLDGWKAFLKGRFGLPGLDSDARNAVHGLTTLCRNWERKAFLARYLQPSQNTTSLNSWERKRWRGRQGQTMGYQPSIDSYEEMHGTWVDRRELLAWSAGTQIALRVKETGSKAAGAWEAGHDGDAFGPYEQLVSWYTYQIPQGHEGRDDITALKLLRPHQKSDASEHIAFGTASGDLSLLSVDLDLQKRKVHDYGTNHRSVGSLSISSSDNPTIAAILGDSTLALYPVHLDASEGYEQESLSEVDPVVLGARGGRLWSCNFISQDRVAVGMGPTFEPIQIYEVTSSGFIPEPLRKFSLDSKFWSGSRNVTNPTNSSVYPIVPLPNSANDRSSAGNLFLSGGYDGIIRLHDMRSPHSFETMYWDVTNDSTVYSLATHGLERVVVGTSMHSMLKVFDLRLSGSHAYRAIPLSRPKTNAIPRAGDYVGSKIVSDAVCAMGAMPISGGWNLFLSPRNRHRQNRGPRTEESPVYSLSIPSPTSSSLYAGVEAAVLSLDFLSVADKHPDPLFTSAMKRFTGSSTIDMKYTYNPTDDVLNLGMYEQGNEQALGMKLMVQDGVGMGVGKNAEGRDFAKFRDVDERWKDPSDESGRWMRGQETHGRRGGGRGRSDHGGSRSRNSGRRA
jgi:WD40 repeat protein